MDAIQRKNTWWAYLGDVRHMLYCVFLFFLPFTQALTFNVGFPLKLSELTLFILAFLYLLFNKRTSMPRPLALVFSLLFVVVTVSFAINLHREFPYILRTYETRFGYTGDSVARYIYFILALLSFFISLDIFLTDRERYVKVWMYGALAAGAYSLYLSVFSTLNLPVFLLPGMQHPPQTINGHIIRCGTFLEGNLMGLYLVLSAALCFYIGKIKEGIFLLVAVFTTFSTLSTVSVFLFLVIYLQRQIFKRKYLVYIIPAMLVMAGGLVLFTQTGFYKSYIHEKIFGSADKVTTAGDYSKVDRVFSTRAAFRMGTTYPVFGVGLANYARHFDYYVQRGNMPEHDYNTFLRKGEKVIPNNIYVEVMAESGVIALALFFAFLLLLLYYSRSDPSQALTPAVLSMMICFIAYPSFIMIYLWAFMAIPVADYIARKRQTYARTESA